MTTSGFAQVELGSEDDLDLDPLACPGVFYPTAALDGILSRIRTPGGMVSADQCRLVAEVAAEFAGGTVSITNRANLQLRALDDRLPLEVLRRLQAAGLASRQPLTDHLRNIMASPTAGLDGGALFDTRPFVQLLDAYIGAHPELGAVPAKFSIGLDGGELASISSHPNDLLFRAVRHKPGAEVGFRVLARIGAGDGDSFDLGVALRPGDLVAFAATVAEFYLESLPDEGSKPRLRHLLADGGVGALSMSLRQRLPGIGELRPERWETPAPSRPPVGVHAQADDGRVYVGVAPLLGGLSVEQLRGLAGLADEFGSGSIRLSPWRNVVLADLPEDAVAPLQAGLDSLGLCGRDGSLRGSIVACAGSAGCHAGMTDTIRDARRLTERLDAMDHTIDTTVHFTGCGKCCAQRRPSGITLLGRDSGGEAYDVYVAGGEHPRLGGLLHEAVAAADVIELVAGMLRG